MHIDPKGKRDASRLVWWTGHELFRVMRRQQIKEESYSKKQSINGANSHNFNQTWTIYNLY